ncbi:TPM domain-containing protein [Ichthyenterobacterium magnum]|uniref:TLP18.3/Psb32/MOLO-1 phosphatase superfamily protein n=1 Tax=Ichthyenterobacterium magnum TaxID=1230530 RepID=A0A420DVH3_9FLAO|nr:TPM domain-containing protein [Ichthyenterobacterium magnum]RKE98224.1 TLP18.3/Psb32/MOLO-1 phosphatase superfamily protein [Ichthyenterobacterium magnum]
MSNSIEDFLPASSEIEVVKAIRKAEQNTSGEVRVHLEKTSKGNIDSRTLEVFNILKMYNTKLRNGVLIYVAVDDKSFAIYGDKGINTVVSDNFWNSTKDIIQNHFKSGNFKQGLVDGVLKAGEQLKHFFPRTDGDEDELTNTISKS